MDLQAQEKAAKIIKEQADKLSTAMAALRKITRLPGAATGKDIAVEAIREISNYGKNPEDL